MKIPDDSNGIISNEFLKEMRGRQRAYNFAVWALPISAIVITLGAVALATLDIIPGHWPPRFGSVCVATGVIALNHLARPNYRIENNRLTYKDDIPLSLQKAPIGELVLADSNILFGTLMWGFGDLFFA